MADAKDLAAKEAAFNHPIWVPDDFKNYLDDFALQVATDFYAQDIQGLRAARWHSAPPQVDPIACNSTFSGSGGYGDCVNGEDMRLTGLSNGIWMVVWGFAALDAFTHSSVIFVNDDYADGRGSPGNHDWNELFTTQGGSCMGAAVWTIDEKTIGPGQFGVSLPLGRPDGNNKIAVKYAVSSAGARFEKRWMHAIRVDELLKLGNVG